MEIESHVPKVARGTGSSAENRTVHQGSASDSRAQCKENGISSSASCAPEHFRNQSGAGVVVGADRYDACVDHIRQ